jgi:hypothetical protein
LFCLLLLLKCNLFSPWYSWHIAHLALNKNHSLTYSKSHEILEYSSCPNKLRWKHLCNDKMFTSSNLRHRCTIEPPYFEVGLSLFLSQNMSDIVRTVVSGITLIRQNIGKPNNFKVFSNKKAKGQVSILPLSIIFYWSLEMHRQCSISCFSFH